MFSNKTNINTTTSNDENKTIQTPATITKFDPFAADFASRLPEKWRHGQYVHLLSDEMQKLHKCWNKDDMKRVHVDYIPNETDLFVTLGAGDQLDVCTANMYKPLSKHGRIKLTRAIDFLEEVEVVSAPRDEVIDLTLFAQFFYPKDLRLYQEWLESQETTNDNWQFLPDQSSSFYYPLVKVENVTGPVSFFDSPLSVYHLPFHSFSIQVDGLGHGINRHIRLKCGMYSNEFRGKMKHSCKIYENDIMSWLHPKRDVVGGIVLL
jgi:hypothetical protein